MAPEPADKPAEKGFDKFEFLVCYTLNTSDGKTDWAAIIEEQNVVTIAAAKKRFERMMKPYSMSERSLNALSSKASPKKVADEGANKNKGGSPKKKGSPRQTKKRKVVDMDPATEEEDAEKITAGQLFKEGAGK